MKEEMEILSRISELKEKILFLEEKTNDELQKDFWKRDYRALIFFSRECSIYKFSLSQMEWVLSAERGSDEQVPLKGLT